MTTLIISLLLSALTLIGALTVGIWAGTIHADRKHRKRAPSQPPENIDGLTRRAHPGWQTTPPEPLIKTFKQGGILFAPEGTDINDHTQWQELGYLHEDGYLTEPDEIDIREWGTNNLIRTEQLPYRHVEPNPGDYLTYFSTRKPEPILTNITFEVTRKYRRDFMKYMYGQYRFPGDKPLIHKGGKP